MPSTHAKHSGVPSAAAKLPALHSVGFVEPATQKITDFHMRLQDPKRKCVNAFRLLNFKTIATGDSYNDTTMLGAADAGILFDASENVIAEFPQARARERESAAPPPRASRRRAPPPPGQGRARRSRAPPRPPQFPAVFGYEALKEEFLKADDRLGPWSPA